jgi:hypothetical protein
MNEIVDFVILFPGQSYVVPLVKAEAEKVWTELVSACTPDEKGGTKFWVTLKDGSGRSAQLKVPSIMGWYIKEHSLSLQDRVLKKMDKTLDQQVEDDSWKNSDDPLA